MIITCANCGKKNRVPESHTQTGVFCCGACGHEIAEFTTHANPSKSPNETTSSKKRSILTLVFGSVIAVCVCITAFCFLPHQVTRTKEPTIQTPSALQAASGNSTPNPQATPEALEPVKVAPVQAIVPHEDFSLPNGTELIHRRNRKGKGLIEISNGSNSDAVVKLIIVASQDHPSARAYRMVYVKAGNSTTVAHVKPNTYEVVFCAGRDWNGKKFLKDASFTKFDEPFPFEEKVTNSPDSIRTIFSKYTISLHGVYNGTARTSTASQEEFDAPEDSSPE